MSGIDNILAKLSEDCAGECKAVIDDAEKQADSVINRAKEQARLQSEKIASNAASQADEIMRLAESSVRMKQKQYALSQRVEVLNSVLRDALNELCDMSGDEYYSVMEKFAVKNALKGDGLLVMNDSDAKDAPPDFIEKINSAIKDFGSLTMKPDADFKAKGIVLVYGDVEINLTFEAILSADEDIYKDTARKILFG